MWAQDREGDNVAVLPNPARNGQAELQQHAGRIVVGMIDGKWLIDLQLLLVSEPDSGVADPRKCGSGRRRIGNDAGDDRSGCRRGQRAAAQKLPAADLYESSALHHLTS